MNLTIRKSLLLLLATSVIAGAFFMMYLLFESLSHNRTARQNLEVVPGFGLFDLDSGYVSLHVNRKTVFVYFDSGCEHCHYELNQIITNGESFVNTEVILMSSEPIAVIKSFADKNYPWMSTNIRFSKINAENAYSTLGNLIVPQILIYGADGKLIKAFKGETKIDAILQYL